MAIARDLERDDLLSISNVVDAMDATSLRNRVHRVLRTYVDVRPVLTTGMNFLVSLVGDAILVRAMVFPARIVAIFHRADVLARGIKIGYDVMRSARNLIVDPSRNDSYPPSPHATRMDGRTEPITPPDGVGMCRTSTSGTATSIRVVVVVVSLAYLL